MDEKKRHDLEELKKQINPEVLRKMAEYLGGEQARGSQTASESPSAIESLMDKKTTSFQEKVRQRKMQADLEAATRKKETPSKIKGCMVVYSTTGIWSRIMQNIFNGMGFRKIHCVDAFRDLIYYLLRDCFGKENACSVAVNIRDISKFIIAWENLKRSEFDPSLYLFLDQIKYFCVIESSDQVMPALRELLGDNRILLVKDPVDVNRKKVMTVLGIAGGQ